MEDRQFRRVLEALGYSFEGYRRVRNNVLTYRDDAGRRGVLAQVAAQLHPGGLLAIGRKESLPVGVSGLTPAAAALPCLYLKTDRVLVHPGSNV